MTELAGQHFLWQLASVFAGGLVSVATPCVFPLLPVTIAAFGIRPETSRTRAFLLSLAYVLGISFTYTTLGIFSARTGKIFGAALGNHYVVAALVVFVILLALLTLDVFQLRALSKLQTASSRVGGRGFLGVFLMGAASGFVAAPCIGPILGTILTIAGTYQDVSRGAILLFVYSLGFGLPFLVLGTFSGLLDKLPRSGSWLLGIKVLIAVALFMTAIFLLDGIFPVTRRLPEIAPQLLILAVMAGIAGAAIGVLRQRKLPTVIASIVIAFGAFVLFVPRAATPHDEGVWITSIEEAQRAAGTSGRPIMLDLFAEWCAACKELAAKTFPDPAVQEEFGRYVLARLDFTQESPVSIDIAARYAVMGLPTILFLDQNGAEIADSRIEGFLPPAQFAAHLKATREKFAKR